MLVPGMLQWHISPFNRTVVLPMIMHQCLDQQNFYNLTIGDDAIDTLWIALVLQ
jgi:hypothetical protein